MRILPFYLIVWALLGTEGATAQSLAELSTDPQVLAEAFVRGQLKPAADALTGEAAANPISLSKLPRNNRISSQQHWRGDGRALVSVTFANGTEAGDLAGEDLYVFLDSTDADTWRIAAFRDWDLPRGYRQQLNRYRNKSEGMLRRDYEAQFEASGSRGVTRAQHDAVHGGVERRVFTVYNLRLAASSDAALARHQEFLRDRFEVLRKRIEERPQSALAIQTDDEALGEELRYLLIRKAYHSDQGPLRLEIANLEGDDVGYLYCTEPACVPTPTPDGVVALLDLGEGWWLYRTL